MRVSISAVLQRVAQNVRPFFGKSEEFWRTENDFFFTGQFTEKFLKSVTDGLCSDYVDALGHPGLCYFKNFFLLLVLFRKSVNSQTLPEALDYMRPLKVS